MISDTRVLHIPSNFLLKEPQWKWEFLEDLCEGVFDCPHSTPKISETGPLMARSQDIRSGIFRVEEAARVSQATFEERTKRARPAYGDLIYSREGTYFGIAAEVPENVDLCLGQRMVLIRPKNSYLNSRYLRYWLNCRYMQDHIHGQKEGTVAERLNLPTIRQLPILLPPMDVQNSIANFLGSLDDKIEINRKLSTSLEEFVRAFFKEWFIDFGPVKAKTEVRKPFGMDDETAALFPDSFENSELGPIPEGWKVKAYLDDVTVIGGGTPKTSVAEYWDGDIPWFSVVDSPRESDVWVIDTEKKITTEGLNSSSTKILDIGTSVITARGTVGKIALVGTPMAMNQSCYALKSKNDFSHYYYYLLKSLVAQLKGRSHGSVFDTITTSTLASLNYAKPTNQVLQKFEDTVAPLLIQIKNNLYENRTLSALRDLLLPKLISGEIAVKESQ